MKSKQIIQEAQIESQKAYLLNKEENTLLSILSTMDCCQQIIKASRQFRARIYTPFQTILSFIKQVLDADKSCSKAVISVASEHCFAGKKAMSILTGAYVKARQRLPEETLYQLVRAVGIESSQAASLDWKPYNREVKVCDGTTVDMPDTKANKAVFPPHNNKTRTIGFPLARIVAVMSLTTGGIIDYAVDAFKGKGTGEVSLLRTILGCFKENDLFIADRLYCNFFLICDLMKKQVDVIVPGLRQRRYDFGQGLCLKRADRVTRWKKPKRPEWMSIAHYQDYPKTIQIREFKIGGVVYITTFLDSKIYPKKELRMIYIRRWEMETNLNSIKTTMKMDTLSCKTPSMVRKEIGIHLLAYNIIRSLMVKACLRQNALPWHVSFKGTIQLLEAFLPHLLSSSHNPTNTIYNEFFRLIITKKVGNRPGRIEPRLLKQRRQKFPNLKQTRSFEQQKLRVIAHERITNIENDLLFA